MHPQRDLAITLRSVAYEERHRIVTALTLNHGLVSALAKNSIQSRRFGGSLELFAASEWNFTSKPGAELLYLSEAHIREPFEKLRGDFTKLSLASVLNELMLKLAPQGEACPDLFRLHSNALAALNSTSECGPHEIAFLNAYLAKLLQWNGSQPRLQQCLGCEVQLDQLAPPPQSDLDQAEISVDPRVELSCVIPSAGWICFYCRSQSTQHLDDGGQRLVSLNMQQSFLRVTPAAIRDLQLSLCIPIRQVSTLVKGSRKDHQELFRFLEALFAYHVPGFDQKPLKSLRFLELESNLQPAAMNPQ